jgi:tyrosine-protein kinase
MNSSERRPRSNRSTVLAGLRIPIGISSVRELSVRGRGASASGRLALVRHEWSRRGRTVPTAHVDRAALSASRPVVEPVVNEHGRLSIAAGKSDGARISLWFDSGLDKNGRSRRRLARCPTRLRAAFHDYNEWRTAFAPAPRTPMNEDQRPLSYYLQAVKRQGWLVMLVLALSVLVSYAVVASQKSVYRASTKIVVGQGGGQFQSILGNQGLTLTMTNLFESEVVARQVIQTLGLQATTDDLLKQTHVTVRPDSSVLNISYDASSRRQAVRILSTYAAVYTKLVDDLRRGTGKNRNGPFATVDANVWDPPHALQDRVSPKPKKTIGFAAVLGLALGLILAVVRESLDDRIRTQKEAEELFGAPVIAVLPKGIRRRPPPAIRTSGKAGDALLEEKTRMLAASIEWSGDGVSGPTILVTSGLPDEGKTTVTANLGIALALAGHEVVCVDADLRRPKLHEYLGLSADGEGLLQVLGAQADPERVLRSVSITVDGRDPSSNADDAPKTGDALADNNSSPSAGRLRVLTAGGAALGRRPQLTQEATSSLLERLAAEASYVLVDAPPLLQMADALPLALSADTVLIVSRRGRSTKESAAAVRATLEGLGIRRTALVLTDVASSDGVYGHNG